MYVYNYTITITIVEYFSRGNVIFPEGEPLDEESQNANKTDDVNR